MTRLIVVFGLILVAAVAAPPARADDGGADAGVVLRLYDIGEPMRALPSIAPGELPNVVRILPTFDLQSANGAFEPLKDNFMTEVLGLVRITEPGQYGFRLISDDGAKLWIDGRLVVDHDGLHGPVPKDGFLELTAGDHPLRIMHFDAGGGEALSLTWRPPGTGAGAGADYVQIPPGALGHDPGIGDATSPGRKRVIMPLRRGLPGDGSPLGSIHPSFDRATVPMDPDRRRPEDRSTAGPPSACAHLPIHGEVAPMQGLGLILLPPDDRSTGPVSVAPLLSPAGSAAGLTPYEGSDDSASDCHQVIVADRDRDELFRVFAEQVNGIHQGCAFRFAGGWPGPLDTVAVADSTGILAWTTTIDPTPEARFAYAAHVLTGTDRRTFEMAAVRALTNGLELEFTKPLDVRVGWEADAYHVEQWTFDADAGQPPRRDGVRYPVEAAYVSRDRRRVFLQMDSLETSRLVYVRLLPPCLSEDGERPWTTEAWYTLNAKPADRPGKRIPGPSWPPRNYLTPQEKADGWRLLFDGRTTRGWRAYGRDDAPTGWEIQDGCLIRVGSGGDIMTEEEFDDFELTIDWRISAGGNSGIFYRVDATMAHPWQTGPEMQVLDNREHIDGRDARTSAGSNYALHAPVSDVTEPVGLFNRARILVRGDHVEHWLNGVKLLEYDLGSADWSRRVADGKFASMPHYGRAARGRIVLQDHGDRVWYMNVKIREPGGADR